MLPGIAKEKAKAGAGAWQGGGRTEDRDAGRRRALRRNLCGFPGNYAGTWGFGFLAARLLYHQAQFAISDDNPVASINPLSLCRFLCIF